MTNPEHIERRMIAPHGQLCWTDGEPADTDDDAIVRRVAACWNACDGVETEALEAVANSGTTLRGALRAIARVYFATDTPEKKLAYEAQQAQEHDSVMAEIEAESRIVREAAALLLVAQSNDRSTYGWGYEIRAFLVNHPDLLPTEARDGGVEQPGLAGANG